MGILRPRIEATHERVSNRAPSFLIQWSGLGAEAIGSAEDIAGSEDRSVQLSGTFDGACMRIEGSNDGQGYEVITALNGTPLVMRASALEGIREAVRFVRPVVEGGSTHTQICVSLLMRMER